MRKCGLILVPVISTERGERKEGLSPAGPKGGNYLINWLGATSHPGPRGHRTCCSWHLRVGPVSLGESHISRDSEIDVYLGNTFQSVTKINRPSNKAATLFPAHSLHNIHTGRQMIRLLFSVIKHGTGKGVIQMFTAIRLKYPKVFASKKDDFISPTRQIPSVSVRTFSECGQCWLLGFLFFL